MTEPNAAFTWTEHTHVTSGRAYCGWSASMPIEAASSIRAAAAEQRETARVYRAEVAAENAAWRRDQRIDEAKATAAARPTPADRAAATPARATGGAATSALFVDVVA